MNVERKTLKTIYREEIIDVTDRTCECWFLKTMELVCRLILKLLSLMNQNLFVKDICSERWSRRFYNVSHQILNQSIINHPLIEEPSLHLHVPNVIHKKPIEEVDKYKKMKTLSKKISEFALALPISVHSTIIMDYCTKLKVIYFY